MDQRTRDLIQKNLNDPTNKLRDEPIADTAKTALGGALKGVDMLFRGGGEILSGAINKSGQALGYNPQLSAVSPLEETGVLPYLRDSRSPATQKALQDSQITGSVLKPSEVSFGKDPSARGIGLQILDTVGQVAPQVGLAAATGGMSLPAQAAVTGAYGLAQGTGAGAEEAEQYIGGLKDSQLYEYSGEFRKRVNAGMPLDQARKEVSDLAKTGGSIGQGATAAAGQAIEGALMNLAFKGKTPGKGPLTRALFGGTTGFVGEGIEEGSEGVAGRFGQNVMTGGNQSLDEGTFPEVVLGGFGGGPTGAVISALSPPDNAPPLNTQTDTRPTTDLSQQTIDEGNDLLNQAQQDDTYQQVRDKYEDRKRFREGLGYKDIKFDDIRRPTWTEPAYSKVPEDMLPESAKQNDASPNPLAGTYEKPSFTIRNNESKQDGHTTQETTIQPDSQGDSAGVGLTPTDRQDHGTGSASDSTGIGTDIDAQEERLTAYTRGGFVKDDYIQNVSSRDALIYDRSNKPFKTIKTASAKIKRLKKSNKFNSYGIVAHKDGFVVVEKYIDTDIDGEARETLKAELNLAGEQRKKQGFYKKHTSPFAQSLINNDYEKSVDDLYRGRINHDDAISTLTDAKNTGLLNSVTISKIESALTLNKSLIGIQGGKNKGNPFKTERNAQSAANVLSRKTGKGYAPIAVDGGFKLQVNNENTAPQLSPGPELQAQIPNQTRQDGAIGTQIEQTVPPQDQGADTADQQAIRDQEQVLTNQPLTNQQQDINEQQTTEKATQEAATKETGAEKLPAIVAVPKKKYIAQQVKERGIKKGSPGFDTALNDIESRYDDDLADALGALPFEQYKALPENDGRSESELRGAHEAMGGKSDSAKVTAEVDTLPAQKSSTVDEIVTSVEKDFPISKVASSWNGISHNGGVYAKSEKADLKETIKQLHDEALKLAETDKQKAAMIDALNAFKNGYFIETQKLSNARSGSYSTLIAGKSKFNSKQAGKRSAVYDKASSNFSRWLDAAKKSVKRAVLDARDQSQLDAEAAIKQEKENKKIKQEEDLIRTIDNFKKGDTVKFGLHNIARVTRDRLGYPSAVVVDATDLSSNKFNLASVLFDNDKSKLYAVVDKVRGEVTQEENRENKQPGNISADNILSTIKQTDNKLQKRHDAKDGNIAPTVGKDGRLHAPHDGYTWIDDKVYAGGEFLPDDDSTTKSKWKKIAFTAITNVADHINQQFNDIAYAGIKLGKVYEKNGESLRKVYIEGTPSIIDALRKQLPSTEKKLMTKDEADAKGLSLGKTWKYSHKKALNKAITYDLPVDGDSTMDKKEVGYYYPDSVIRDISKTGEITAASDTGRVDDGAVNASTDTAITEEEAKKQAQKLRALGDKLLGNAKEEQSRDRATHTARMARMSGSAIEQALKNEALAKSINNIANAIESGEAKSLSKITNKTQIETLDEITNHAIIRRDGKRFDSYAEQQKHRGRKFENADLNFVEYPTADLNDGNYGRLTNKLREVRGGKGIAKEIGNTLTREQLQKIIKLLGEKDADYYVGWYPIEQLKKQERLKRMGIESQADLEQAISDYVEFKEGVKKEDKAAVLERELSGKKGIGLDYFPTPKALAERMVADAGIESGMKVLEPSAGNGNIADAMKATGADVDVVELSGTLREVLEAKGHNVVDHDFMNHNPGAIYDAIVMNPPFSNSLDAEHIQHAFTLLKPGGKLIAISGEGIHFRNDKKAIAFREWLDSHDASVEKLPEGTFKDKTLQNTTGVNARLIEIEKPVKFSKGQSTGSTVSAITQAISQNRRAKKMLEAGDIVILDSVSELKELISPVSKRESSSIQDSSDLLFRQHKFLTDSSVFKPRLKRLNNILHREFASFRFVSRKPSPSKSQSDGMHIDIKGVSDFIISKPFVKKTNSLINRVVKIIGRDMIPMLSEEVLNSTLMNLKLFADFNKTHAVGNELFSKLDIPSKRMMFGLMFRVANNFKIVDDIISLVPVDVVNMLAREKITPYMLFNDVSMFIDRLSIDGNNSISSSIYSAFISALNRTEIGSAVINAAFRPNDFGSTRITRSKNLVPGEVSSTFFATEKSPGGAGGSIISGDGDVTGATIDDRHNVTPYSNVMLDGGVVSTTSSSPIISDNIQGAYINGKIFLVSNNLSKHTVTGVLNHELLHSFLAQNNKVRSLLESKKAGLREIFDSIESGKYKGLYKDIYEGSIQRVNQAETEYEHRFEEFLSHSVELYNKSPESLPAKLRKLVQNFIAYVRAIMIRAGIPVGKITPADLNQLALSAMKPGKADNAIAMAKAAGYQGFSKSEAEEWLQAKADGLDMSKAARMKRAKEMGFDVDTVYYHGTRRNFKAFESQNPRGAIGNKKGIYFTKDRSIAEEWAIDDGADYLDDKSNIISVFLKNPEIKGGYYDEAIVTNPNQIRSIHAAFNPRFKDSGNLLASNQAQRFYSQLRKALSQAPSKIFTSGKQVALWLKGNAPKIGVKQDEIYWSGIEEWLDLQEGNISKDDVLSYLDQNGVKVETVVLNDLDKYTIEDSSYYYDTAKEQLYFDLYPYLDLPIIKNLSQQFQSNDDGDPVGAGWLLGGKGAVLNGESSIYSDKDNFIKHDYYGEDIRSMNNIYDLPFLLKRAISDSKLASKTIKATTPEYINIKQSFLDFEKSIGKILDSITITTPVKHNTDQLTLPGGRDYQELVITIPTAESFKADDETHFGDIGGGKQIAWIRHNSRTDKQGNETLFLEEVQSQRSQEGRKQGFGNDVPPAPFVTDANKRATNAYITLLLKQAISHAIDNGQASISWTTGDQQADRYDLSKQVEKIVYYKENKELHTYKGSMLIDSQLNVAEDKLSDYIGKELAERLLAAKVRTDSDGNYQALAGLDLKIGGAWTQAMYGNEQGLNAQGSPALVTQAARDIAKKFGGKVGTISTNIGTQPALIITQKMRDRVKIEGMPLFSIAKTNDTHTATFSEKRTDRLFNEYAYSSDDNASKAYLVLMSPEQFLSATTNDEILSQLKSKAKPLDLNELSDEHQNISLYGTMSKNGEFITEDHEGRNRTLALMNSGASQLPVVLNVGKRFDGQIVENVTIKGQRDLPGARASTLNGNAIPISYNNRQAIVNMATNENASQSIKFSKRADFDKKVAQIFNKLDDGIDAENIEEYGALGKKGGPILDQLSSIGDWATKYLTTLDNLARKNIVVRPFLNLAKHMQMHKDELLSHTNDAIKVYNSLGDNTVISFAKGLFDAEKGKSAEQKALDSALIQGTLDEVVYSDAQLKTFGLSQKGIDAYREIRKYMDDMTDRYKDALLERLGLVRNGENIELVNPTGKDSDAEKLKLGMKLMHDFAELKGYFPLMRFGEHLITVRNDKGTIVYFAAEESPKDMRKHANRIKAEFDKEPGEYKVTTGYLAINKRDDLAFDPRMLNMLGKYSDEIPGFAQIFDQVEQDVLKNFSDSQFKKRFIHRKGIKGFDSDTSRVIASYGWSSSNYISKMRFVPKMQTVVDEIDRHKDPKTMMHLQDTLDYIKTPSKEFQGLKSFTFAYFMAANVKSAVVNLTQIPVTLAPYLANKFGDKKAAVALKRAIVLAAKKIPDKPTDPAQQYLKWAEDEGLTFASYLGDLIGAASGKRQAQSRLSNQALQVFTYMFSAAEQYNRRVSVVAAYELAKGLKLHELNAILTEAGHEAQNSNELAMREFIELTITKTQFDYSKHNKPPAFRGVGSIPLQFQQFMFNYIQFIAGNGGGIGATTRSLGALLLMAGAMGLPGMDDLRAALEYAHNKATGKHIDLQLEARKALVDASKDFFGDSLARELSQAMVFGIPSLTPFDISGSVGMGNIGPGIATFFDESKESGEMHGLAAFIKRASGPSMGIGEKVTRGIEELELSGSWYRFIEKAAPLSIQNFMRAMRIAKEGTDRNYAGKVSIAYHPSAMEIFAQALSFTPGERKELYRQKSTEYRESAFLKLSHQKMLNRLSAALAERDKKGIVEARRLIGEWNKEVPTKWRLPADKIRRSMKLRGKHFDMPTQDRTKALQKDFDEYRSYYG